jgi:hypothetical protein
VAGGLLFNINSDPNFILLVSRVDKVISINKTKLLMLIIFFRDLYYLHVHSAYVFLNQNFDKNLSNILNMNMVLCLNVYTYEILNYIFDEKPKIHVQ